MCGHLVPVSVMSTVCCGLVMVGVMSCVAAGGGSYSFYSLPRAAFVVFRPREHEDLSSDGVLGGGGRPGPAL